MKFLFSFLIVLFSNALFGQCPFIRGAMIDASNAGTPTGEGKNEFIVFTTGTSALPITGFSVGYGNTTAANNFTIDGATVTWSALAVSPAITNSAGSITNITSGSIPANTPVVILNNQNAISYDLAAFGSNVYVLVYSTGTGVSGYASGGNFANKSSPAGLRYFRVTAGACNNVVSYDKNDAAMSSSDGAGAQWDATGTITFYNTGSSGAVLPIQLTHFSGNLSNGYSSLQWRTSGNSTAQSFEIEKSIDGNGYSKIGTVSAQIESSIAEKSYEYTYQNFGSKNCFYRLRTIDIDGTANYSPTLKLKGGNDETPVNSSVYPNPFTNELRLNVYSTNGFSEMQLFDFMGKKHLQQTLQAGENIINVAEMPAGFYFVHLKSATKTETFKVWKN